MDIRPFKKQRIVQTPSRLLRLPAELRLMVLRQLLRSPGPIEPSTRSCYWELGPGEYEAQAGRSSQVLQCCQTLHDEGSAILYGENILTIIANGEFGYRFVRMLTFCAQYKEEACYPPSQQKISMQQGLRSESLRSSDFPLANETRWSAEVAEVAVAITKRFSRFQLRIGYDTHENLLTVARVLHNTLLGREVSVTLEPKGWAHDPHEVRPLRLLRCRNVEIHSENIVEKDKDSTCNIITSKTPATDLWGVFMALPIARLPQIQNQRFFQVHSLAHHAARDAALYADEIAFDKAKEDLCTKIRQWLARWTKEKHAEIEDMNTSILPMLNA